MKARVSEDQGREGLVLSTVCAWQPLGTAVSLSPHFPVCGMGARITQPHSLQGRWGAPLGAQGGQCPLPHPQGAQSSQREPHSGMCGHKQLRPRQR